MSEHENYYGGAIHVNQHKVQPVQQVWICASFRGYPKITEQKARNKKMKSHHDIVDASPRPPGNAPSVSAIRVACERRRISGRRYTLRWREATKGNMSWFEGYRVIFGSINYFIHPTVSMSSHP